MPETPNVAHGAERVPLRALRLLAPLILAPPMTANPPSSSSSMTTETTDSTEGKRGPCNRMSACFSGNCTCYPRASAGSEATEAETLASVRTRIGLAKSEISGSYQGTALRDIARCADFLDQAIKLIDAAVRTHSTPSETPASSEVLAELDQMIAEKERSVASRRELSQTEVLPEVKAQRARNGRPAVRAMPADPQHGARHRGIMAIEERRLAALKLARTALAETPASSPSGAREDEPRRRVRREMCLEGPGCAHCDEVYRNTAAHPTPSAASTVPERETPPRVNGDGVSTSATSPRGGIGRSEEFDSESNASRGLS